VEDRDYCLGYTRVSQRGVYHHWYNVWAIVILHELGTGFRRGIAPVFGSGNFGYAYGTPANVNQVGLLYLLS